ncbi:hypothetical protein ACWGJ2_18125 [Streptomyces sp. NPDC054796]
MSPRIPPARMSWEIRPAGRDWDAVRMPGPLGRAVLAQLGDSAAVFCEDDGRLVFLIPCGGRGWFEPGTEYLSTGAWLFMPGPQCTHGPGMRWLAGHDRARTSVEALRAALEAVRQQTPEVNR